MTDVVLISGEKRERVFLRDEATLNGPGDTLSQAAEEGTTVELYGDKIYIQTTEDGGNGSVVISSTVRFTKTCLSNNRTQISITNTKSLLRRVAG